MPKIRLDLSELEVESFQVAGRGGEGGTVHGCAFSEYCVSDPAATCHETAYGMVSCAGYGSCDPAMLCRPTDINLGCDGG